MSDVIEIGEDTNDNPVLLEEIFHPQEVEGDKLAKLAWEREVGYAILSLVEWTLKLSLFAEVRFDDTPRFLFCQSLWGADPSPRRLWFPRIGALGGHLPLLAHCAVLYSLGHHGNLASEIREHLRLQPF